MIKYYSYHKKDLRKEKNIYQYSKYYGRKFLKEFFFSRNYLIKKFKPYKNTLKFSKDSNIKKNKIKNLCRRFELKKKLFKNKKNKSEFLLSDYINISNLIANYLLQNMNYSILSTFLKMNDLIIYMYNKKKKNLKNNEQLKKIIFLESIIINKILYEKKIK